MRLDLHCHSTFSDGALTPRELLRRAHDARIDVLALTDHDTCAGLQALRAANSYGIRLVPAIEFSSLWNKIEVHVVGLDIDPDSPAFLSAVNQQQNARQRRAETIAESLRKRGLPDLLPRALAFAGDGSVGRPHFARALIAHGVVDKPEQAFKRYLGRGKAGDVRVFWANLKTVVDWIRTAGGIPVLAHPNKYSLTRTRLIHLLSEFKDAGGLAMEVVSGQQSPEVTRHLAKLCNDHQLLASSGSDFHRPGQPWAELGRQSILPDYCHPVWNPCQALGSRNIDDHAQSVHF